MQTLKSKLPQITLRYTATKMPKARVNNSQDAHAILQKLFSDDTIELFESFIVLYLNRANSTIGYQVISQGGVSGTIVDCRLIFTSAITCCASGIILSHNHPSGNLTASQQDIELTIRIKEICKLVNIQLIDHLILSPDSTKQSEVRETIFTGPKPYMSFSDNGLI